MHNARGLSCKLSACAISVHFSSLNKLPVNLCFCFEACFAGKCQHGRPSEAAKVGHTRDAVSSLSIYTARINSHKSNPPTDCSRLQAYLCLCSWAVMQKGRKGPQTSIKGLNFTTLSLRIVKLSICHSFPNSSVSSNNLLLFFCYLMWTFTKNQWHSTGSQLENESALLSDVNIYEEPVAF